MKKALLFMLAIFCTCAVQAVNLTWTQATLPETMAWSDGDSLTNQRPMGDTASGVLDKAKKYNYGVISGTNTNYPVDYDTQSGVSTTVNGKTVYEGEWYNNGENGGQAFIASRKGSGGSSTALILAIAEGAAIDAIKLSFSAAVVTKTPGAPLEYGIGLLSGGSYSEATGSTTNFNSETIEIIFELDETHTALAGDKILIAFNGEKGSAWDDMLAINNIKVEYGVKTQESPNVPEPTALALLALGVAGLALKRKVA